MVDLRDRIRECLAYYYQQPEDVSQRSPWGVMHSTIGYGVDTQVYVDGRKVNAIGWLCWNGDCGGLKLFYTDQGRLRLRRGPGYQGHEGQFLAVLAQARVRRDYDIKAYGYEFTVDDLIEYEKLTCESGGELTFKLIGLVRYLDSDARWKNRHGEEWSIQRIIREELAESVVDAACGGTHRMMGFSYAVRERQRRDEPLVGQWRRANECVGAYHDYTFKLQNADGSFSTDWFRGRGDWGGVDRKLNTTGHTLEWLVYSLPREELTDPRVVNAVEFLTDLLWENRRHTLDIGQLGHAIHALAMYDEYVFDGTPGKRAEQLAEYQSDEPPVRRERPEYLSRPDITPVRTSNLDRAASILYPRRFGAWRRIFR